MAVDKDYKDQHSDNQIPLSTSQAIKLLSFHIQNHIHTLDLDTSVKYLKAMEFDLKYENLVTQIRSVTTRNLGQEARRKRGQGV